MLSNKFTQPFFHVITSNTFTVDLETGASYWDSLYEARVAFENTVSDSLILLSNEQQARLLLQILVSLGDRKSLYFRDEWNFRGKALQKKYNQMQILYQDCMAYKFSEGQGQNRKLSEVEVRLLTSAIISEEFAEANENIRQAYLEREGEEKAILWILDKQEFIAQNSEWKSRERERLGLPPDTRTWIEKTQDVFLENPENTDSIAEETTAAPIPWRYGLADFAETLYKLERKGAIDLKAYFNNGGTGAGLVRDIRRLFTFPNDKPSATLNNYLSEIKKSLGRGPLDAGVLKAIGRIRGGKMDDVLPDESEHNTP